MRLYAAVFLIAAMPSYFRSQLSAGVPPAPWLVFVEGNPGVPGDGKTIFGANPVGSPFYNYDLATPIPLVKLSTGFLTTAFPPRGAAAPGYITLNIYVLNPESACYGDGANIGAPPPVTSLVVNGVQGYSQPESGADVAGIVNGMNAAYPQCELTVSDIYLEGYGIGGTTTLDAAALEVTGLSLSFPVVQDVTGSGVCGGAPCTPYTAPINTVFDHHMHYPYEYTSGVGGYGTILPFTNQLVDGQQSSTGWGYYKNLYGYKYTGSSPLLEGYNYDFQQNGQFVYYDSHPGYDYNFSFGTALYPAVNGCVTYLQTAAGVGTAATGHILAIIPQATPPVGGCQTLTNPLGYSVVYMHLSSYYQGNQNLPHYGSIIRCHNTNGTECEVCTTCAQQNDYVTAGQSTPIGYTGNFFGAGSSGWGGVPSHLHFEVDELSGTKPIIAIDPYGWCGTQYSDPYTKFTGMLNAPLWANFTLVCP
jgi:hypothetical protein